MALDTGELKGSIKLNTSSIDNAIKKIDKLNQATKNIDGGGRRGGGRKGGSAALNKQASATRSLSKAQDKGRKKTDQYIKKQDQLKKNLEAIDAALRSNIGLNNEQVKSLQKARKATTDARSTLNRLGATHQTTRDKIAEANAETRQSTQAVAEASKAQKQAEGIIKSRTKALAQATEKEDKLADSFARSAPLSQEQAKAVSQAQESIQRYRRTVEASGSDSIEAANAYTEMNRNIKASDQAFRDAKEAQQAYTKQQREAEAEARKQANTQKQTIKAVGSLQSQFDGLNNQIEKSTPLTNRQRESVNRLNRAFRTSKKAIERFGPESIQAAKAQKGFKEALAATRAELSDTQQNTTKMRKATRQLQSASVLAAGPLSEFGARAQALGSILTSTNGIMGTTIGILTGLGAGFGVLAASATRTIIEMQKFRSQLAITTNSAAETAKQFERVAEIANASGRRISTLAPAYARIQAAAEQTNLTIEETNTIFEGITVATAAMKSSVADARGIFKAFEQIISKGQIQAEEIRGQLGERLPGAFGILANSIGATTAELNKMLEQGEVGTKEVVKFSERLQELFSAQAAANAESLQGSFNILTNQFFKLNVAFAEATNLESTLTSALQNITSVVKTLKNNIKGIISVTIKLAEVAFSALITALATKLPVAASAAVGSMANVRAAFISTAAVGSGRLVNSLSAIRNALSLLIPGGKILKTLFFAVGTAVTFFVTEAITATEETNRFADAQDRLNEKLARMETLTGVATGEALKKNLNSVVNEIDNVSNRLETLRERRSDISAGIGQLRNLQQASATGLATQEGEERLFMLREQKKLINDTVGSIEKRQELLFLEASALTATIDKLRTRREAQQEFFGEVGFRISEIQKINEEFNKGTEAVREQQEQLEKLQTVRGKLLSGSLSQSAQAEVASVVGIDPQKVKASEVSVNELANALDNLIDKVKEAEPNMKLVNGIFADLTENTLKFERATVKSVDAIKNTIENSKNNQEAIKNLAKELEVAANKEAVTSALVSKSRQNAIEKKRKELEQSLELKENLEGLSGAEREAQKNLIEFRKEFQRATGTQISDSELAKLEPLFLKSAKAANKAGSKADSTAESQRELAKAFDAVTESIKKVNSEADRFSKADFGTGDFRDDIQELVAGKDVDKLRKAADRLEVSLEGVGSKASDIGDKIISSFQTDKVSRSFDVLNAQLDRELSVSGLDKTQRKIAQETDAIIEQMVQADNAINNLSQVGEDERSQARSLGRRRVFQDRAGELISRAQTDEQKERIEEVRKAFVKNKIGPEQFAKEIGKIGNRIEKIEEASKEATKKIQESFADFLFDPFESDLQGMLDSFVVTLRKMAAEAASKNIIENLFGTGPNGSQTGGLQQTLNNIGGSILGDNGGSDNFFQGIGKSLFGGGSGGLIGSGFAGDGSGGSGLISNPTNIGGGSSGFLNGIGSFFGSFLADGGVAPGGKMSIVGEEGPEAIVPKSDANVISNEELGKMGGNGGGQTIVNINSSEQPTVNRRRDSNGDEIVDVSFGLSKKAQKERAKEEISE